MSNGNNWYNLVGRRVAVNVNGEDKPGVIISYNGIAETFTVSVDPFDEESEIILSVDDVELIEPTYSKSVIDRKDDEIKALKIQAAALNSEINALKDELDQSKLDINSHSRILHHVVHSKDQHANELIEKLSYRDADIEELKQDKLVMVGILERKDEEIKRLTVENSLIKGYKSRLKRERDVLCTIVSGLESEIKKLKDKLHDNLEPKDDEPDNAESGEYFDTPVFDHQGMHSVMLHGIPTAITIAMCYVDFMGCVWDDGMLCLDPFEINTDENHKAVGVKVCDALRFRRNSMPKDNKCIDKQDDNVDNSESEKRWVPGISEWFFFVNVNHEGVSAWGNNYEGKDHYTKYVDNNNCFKTHEQAERVADKIREVLKNG